MSGSCVYCHVYCHCRAYLRHPIQSHLTHIHLRDPSILVMETAQHRQGHDVARGLNRATCCLRGFRNTLVDALVRPRAIEIPDVRAEDPPQVGFAHNQHVI